MSRHIDFQERAWNDYPYWQTQDKKTLKRVNELIRDIIFQHHVRQQRPQPAARAWCFPVYQGKDACGTSRFRYDRSKFLAGIEAGVFNFRQCGGLRRRKRFDAGQYFFKDLPELREVSKELALFILFDYLDDVAVRRHSL